MTKCINQWGEEVHEMNHVKIEERMILPFDGGDPEVYRQQITKCVVCNRHEYRDLVI